MTVQERIEQLQLATTRGSGLEQAMLREPVALVSPNGTGNAGVSPTFVVVYESARRAIFKTFEHQSVPTCSVYDQDRYDVPVHEVAAWRLAHALGGRWEQMVPTCVLRALDVGAGALVNWRDGGPDLRVFEEAREQVHAAAFWDALIGQQDRHARNVRFDRQERRLALIDNGFAFARPADRFNASVFLAHRRSQNQSLLTGEEKEALENLLASDSRYGLAEFLAPDRFEAFDARAEIMLEKGMLSLPGAF